jgi:hypothetical protein
MFQLQLFFLLHCDEWHRVVAVPRQKFVTGATLLQLMSISRTGTGPHKVCLHRQHLQVQIKILINYNLYYKAII